MGWQAREAGQRTKDGEGNDSHISHLASLVDHPRRELSVCFANCAWLKLRAWRLFCPSRVVWLPGFGGNSPESKPYAHSWIPVHAGRCRRPCRPPWRHVYFRGIRARPCYARFPSWRLRRAPGGGRCASSQRCGLSARLFIRLQDSGLTTKGSKHTKERNTPIISHKKHKDHACR